MLELCATIEVIPDYVSTTLDAYLNEDDGAVESGKLKYKAKVKHHLQFVQKGFRDLAMEDEMDLVFEENANQVIKEQLKDKEQRQKAYKLCHLLHKTCKNMTNQGLMQFHISDEQLDKKSMDMAQVGCDYRFRQ